MPRLRSTAIIVALLLAGCDSQIHMTGTPAIAPAPQGAAVRALTTDMPTGGKLVTIDNPQLLPEAVRTAADLKVAFGGVKVPVTRNPGGYYTFSVPASARIQQDLSGNLRVVFVMDDTKSQIVTLATGSPVQFAQPPVLTEPGPAFIAKGLDVILKANTAASTEQYQFTWSYGLSPQGPWQPIPGSGKEVEWTPPMPGNFFIKVDAVDRASQQAYSTVTPSALVFVSDAKDVITTEPPSGAIERGREVTLKFNRPSGLKGENLTYAWSYGASPQGPWQVISGDGASVNWLPTNAGSYFVKVETSNRETGDVNTFVSPQAVVFVNEGQPIVQVSSQTVDRGDAVQLTLGIPTAGDGPFTWYHMRAGAQTGWTLMNGTSKSVTFITNEAGAYSFRVDIPQTGGGIKSFNTTDAVLNVAELGAPLLQSDPPNEVIAPGSSVTLQLNAAGVTEDKHKFTWYVSTNPAMGWTALPIDSTSDLYRKRYVWRTSLGGTTVGGQPISPTSAGSYYVRVDATERTGTHSYTFTSAGPVFTVERTASN